MAQKREQAMNKFIFFLKTTDIVGKEMKIQPQLDTILHLATEKKKIKI